MVKTELLPPCSRLPRYTDTVGVPIRHAKLSTHCTHIICPEMLGTPPRVPLPWVGVPGVTAVKSRRPPMAHLFLPAILTSSFLHSRSHLLSHLTYARPVGTGSYSHSDSRGRFDSFIARILVRISRPITPRPSRFHRSLHEPIVA